MYEIWPPDETHLTKYPRPTFQPALVPAPVEDQTMEFDPMGKATTEALFENYGHVWDAERGLIPAERARQLVVSDALVDTGATLISMPRRLIQELGLSRVSSKRVRDTTGPGVAGLYSAVRLTIEGRSCTMDVLEVPDDIPVLIGQIPLESLDFVVDPRQQRLIGNPSHGGEHMYEMY